MKENFGFETVDPDTISKLEKVAIEKKYIIGTPWYSILTNLYYQDSFQYIGAHVKDREWVI